MTEYGLKKDLQATLLNDSHRQKHTSQGPAEFSANAEQKSISLVENSTVEKPKVDNRARAILFMNVQSIFGLLGALVFKKIGREGVSVIEFTLARNLFNFCMIQLCLYYWKLNPIKDFPSKQKLFLGLRAVFGQTGFFLFQLAVLFIPLMLELVIQQTSPFWTSILALLINKEKVERYEYGGMLIGFLGVVVITLSKPSSGSSTYSESTRLTGILIAFTLSWVYSATCVFNRRLKDVHFAVVLFYHCIFGMSAATLIIITEKVITGNPFRIYTLRQYGYLLLCCLFDWLGLSLQTIAFQLTNSGFLSLVGYMGVFYAFVLDYIFYGETISIAECAGALLILVVTIGVSYYKLTAFKG